MIDLIYVLAGIGVICTFAWIYWGLHNNAKTLRQRTLILDAVFAYRRALLDENKVEEYKKVRDLFEVEWELISYEAHEWELMLRRDPMRLYSFMTLAAIEWYKLQDRSAQA